MKKNLPSTPQKQPLSPEKKKLFWQMLFNCAAFTVIYFLIARIFPYIGYVYVAIAAIFGLVYVIYNRGFSGKGVTPEMLPDTMSLSQKEAFIEDAKLRLRKSNWMLTIIFPTIFTIGCDMFYLHVIEGLLAT
ncbi:MAG: hypothetical protein IIX91_06775 [Clostridia bacterium]|jgi:hypothetical protein|nr:hypothetical protein [Clostridia bacterium]